MSRAISDKSKDRAINLFIESGAKDITVEDGTVSYVASCGHDKKISLDAFVRRSHYREFKCRPKCGEKKATSSLCEDRNVEAKNILVKFLSERGAYLVSEYKSAKDPISIKCRCGHIIQTTSPSIKRRIGDFIDCKKCGSKKRLGFSDANWEKKAIDLGLTITDMSIDNWVELVGLCGHEIPRMTFSSFKKRLYRESALCVPCSKKEIFDFNEKAFIDMVISGGGEVLTLDRSEARTVALKYSCGHIGKCGTRNVAYQIDRYGKLLCPSCGLKEHTRGELASTEERACREMIPAAIHEYTEVVYNYREPKARSLELDIYIPSLKIAIEVDGIYWHSSLAGKKRLYHIDKKKHFAEKGIDVINFYDWEINNKAEIVSSMIAHRLKSTQNRIYARKCSLSLVNVSDARDFFQKNHIHEGKNLGGITVGLMYKDEIVCAANFRGTANAREVELKRFASKLNTSVIGGMSRILKEFKRINRDGKKYKTLKTYADLRFSSLVGDNTVYDVVGFKNKKISEPNYKYFRDSRKPLLSRQKFMKHKLKSILPDFDGSKTEWENMRDNGYNRIYDCGNIIMSMDLENDS